MEIEVKVTATTEVAVDFTVTPLEHRFPGPPGAPRYRFVFSDDLVLERIDNKKPGTGLPEPPQNRLAGTIRDSPRLFVWLTRTISSFPRAACFSNMKARICSTYDPDLPTDLPTGQVIVRGVALFDGNFDPLKPLTFAIVGGTGAYEGASGQVTHFAPDGSIRTLKIVL